MTLPDLHLSEDALAAYVDGILSSGADERAAKHLRSCAECRAAVDVEREAKALLGAAPDPSLPAGLMARLLDVPMTADLGGSDRVLAIDGDRLGWSTGSTSSDTRVVERRATAPARPRPQVRPAGAPRPAGRSARARRTRRGLAVSLAGLAFGVIASAASTGASGAA
ncbi:MAG TPA: zf-HC2 domain-containing protein, partial [Mycobacteriales bacterium]|nr:zf-HC2 domain-containing protein [Mycobacteriales bacterium]